MKYLYLMAALLLTACATPQALRPPPNLAGVAAQEQYMRCESFAMQQVQMMGLQNNPFNQLSIQPRIAECLQNLGWSR